MSLTTSNENGVLIVTLDEPERRNPIGHPLRKRLAALLAEAETDGSVGAVVLTGAGGHFSAGGDIRDQNSVTTVIGARDRFVVIKELVGRMVRFPKPLVSAVEGWAAGGGLSLAIACETVVAAETARFAASFGAIGLVPDLGILATLPARVGQGRAQRILLDAARLDASEAHRLGIVDHLTGEGEALARAVEIAREAMRAAPLPRALIKDYFAADLDRALDFERQVQPFLMLSSDAVEGREAFFEKRPPAFQGK